MRKIPTRLHLHNLWKKQMADYVGKIPFGDLSNIKLKIILWRLKWGIINIRCPDELCHSNFEQYQQQKQTFLEELEDIKLHANGQTKKDGLIAQISYLCNEFHRFD